MFPNYYNTDPYAGTNLQNGGIALQGGSGSIQVGSSTPSMNGGPITIQDPNVNPTFVQAGGVLGATTRGAGYGYDPVAERQKSDDLAYLDDQEGLLKGMLTSSQNTLNNGLTQIGDSYDKEVGRTNESKSAATAKYGTQREDTTRNMQTAKREAGTQARSLADSVRRVLGLASGVNSTAYREAAPGMIATDTTEKRGKINETSARNFRDIKTAEDSTMSEFERYLADLLEQRKSKESQLRENVLQTEQGVYNNLSEIARQRALVNGGGYTQVREATAPMRNEIASRQATIDGLFNQYRTPYQTKDVAIATPQLSDFVVDRTGVSKGAAPQDGGMSQYQQFVRRKFGEGAV